MSHKIFLLLSKIILLFIFLVTVSLHAQEQPTENQKNEMDSLIGAIDRHFDTPDEAFKILEMGIKHQYPFAQSRGYSYLSVYYRKHEQKDSAFYYVEKAIKSAKNNNMDDELYSNYSTKANIFIELKQYHKALKWYLLAYEYFRKQDKYPYMVRNIKGNIAKLYGNMGDYELAHQYYIEIINVPNSEKALESYTNNHRSVALNYERQKKYTEAIKWIETAIALGKKYNHTRLYNKMKVDLCDFLIQQGNYQQAKTVFDEVDQGFTFWDQDFFLARIYMGLKKWDLAEASFLKSLDMNKDITDKKKTYKELSDLYIQKNELQKAIQARDRYYQISDSLTIESNKSIVKNTEIGYKLIEEELVTKQLKADNELLQVKNKKQRYIIGATIIVAIIGVFCFFLLLKTIKIHKKLKIIKEKEKKLLEDKVTMRENELNTVVLTISERQKMLTEISNEIKNMDRSDKNFVTLQQKLKKIISSGDDLSAITDRIESQYPGVVVNLKEKYPILSDTEIKYCLLTKLNLSIKETATMLGVAPNTVKTSRSRIKKKMNIPTEVSFKDFLHDIFA